MLNKMKFPHDFLHFLSICWPQSRGSSSTFSCWLFVLLMTFSAICPHLSLQDPKLKMRQLVLTDLDHGPKPGPPAHCASGAAVRAWGQHGEYRDPGLLTGSGLALFPPHPSLSEIYTEYPVCVFPLLARTIYLLTRERRFYLIINIWVSLAW